MDGSPSPLFRPEVSSSRNTRHLGSILLHQPWGYTFAAILAGVFILLVLAFAWHGTYTRKATVSGLLMPVEGLLRLNAPAAGILREVRVVEGQWVGEGEVLFVISGERLLGDGGAQEQIGEQLRRRLAVMERNRQLIDERLTGQQRMLDVRLVSIDDELARFHHEIELLERREELAKVQLERHRKLANTDFIATAQVQRDETDLLTVQGQLQTTLRARASLRRERMELLSLREEAELRHRGEQGDLDNAMALVRQELVENEVRAEQVGVAPFSGVVAGLNAQPGQQVAAGTLLASLIPRDATLTAQLYATSRQAGFIEPGQSVLMRYAAYPYQKFGMASGRVGDVAKSPYSMQELPLHIAGAIQHAAPMTENDLFYRVSVELGSQNIEVYGQQQPLQAGMLLEADIVQDRRRLYEWALEPVYSVTGKWKSE